MGEKGSNFNDPDYRERYWHTASHVMAQAVSELFPGVKLGIGPAIATGFYYDFDVPSAFTPEDLKRIEARMREIIAADLPVRQEFWTREKAEEYFREQNQPYKVELVREIGDERVSIFTQGAFLDLCRGPHLARTGELGVVKLLQTAGAYWRGDEKREMLQRIYGTAYPTEEELERELARLEEMQRRDHRRLGQELDLFSFHEDVGPGLVLWHPRGAIIRHEIETFWRAAHYRAGYELVYTPHIGKAKLWETSGHLGFYRESMYAPLEIDEQEYYLKPMNCPFHILMYQSALRSYRELPKRWAELGTVYRYERSGVLHGLLRVRGFTQDDAHIICRPDQMEEELGRVLSFCLEMLRTFGFERFHVYVSTRPKGKCVGDAARWEAAEAALKKVVADHKLSYDIDEGGGAFYGPKIDIKIADVLEREWQCSTIQFDFNLPERFGMTYIGEDGKEHQPYMIHRALLGAIERFFAVLLENCGGQFPLWLAPEQVRIIPVKDAFRGYGERVCEALVARNVRARVDESNRPMGAKVREAVIEKVPYAVVVGEKESAGGTVTVRLRDGRQLAPMQLNEFVNGVCLERDTRALRSVFAPADAK
ncbi:MAG: threonine--tRNA ligase [bacterium]|nr:threonine--tRNA ligase [bacterium]